MTDPSAIWHQAYLLFGQGLGLSSLLAGVWALDALRCWSRTAFICSARCSYLAAGFVEMVQLQSSAEENGLYA